MSDSSIPVIVITSIIDGQVSLQKRFEPSPIEWVSVLRFLKSYDINKSQDRQMLELATVTNDLYRFASLVRKVVYSQEDTFLMIGCEHANKPKPTNFMDALETVAKGIVIGAEMSRSGFDPADHGIDEDDLPY